MKNFLRCVFFTVVFLLGTKSSWGQQSITALGTATTHDFNIGTSATASFPTGFKTSTNGTWNGGTQATATTQRGGTTGTGILASNSSYGIYNFANGVAASATDRAIGFLTSSNANAYNPWSIIYAFTNNTGSTVTSLDIAFDYEKYRSGSRAWDWTFFHGSAQGAITTAVAAGNQSYSADANNEVVYNPPTSVSKSFTISGLSIANGATYYLRWTSTGSGGKTNGQAIGIDNFSITLNGAPSAKTVTFNGNGSTGGSMSNQTASSTTNLTSNAFSKTGFTFGGWASSVANATTGMVAYTNGQQYNFSADMTIYAIWSFAVQYNSNGGTGSIANQTGYYNSAANTANITLSNGSGFTPPANHIFGGWKINGGGSSADYAGGGTYNHVGASATPRVLHAHWVPAHTVTFYGNGSMSGSMNPQTSSTPVNLTNNTFAKTGCSFSGWNTQANGSGTSYANEALYNFSADIPLHAQWTCITTGTISGSPFCVGNGVTASVSVPYTIPSGTFAGNNTFTAQLSNASGTFSSFTNIGTLPNTTTAGTITATIPAGTAAGGNYRIRVTGSNPSTNGIDNTVNLTVQNFAAPTAFATTACNNATTALSWANPACFDQIMVVAKASTSFSATLPTGDGTAYTASSTYGSGGTAFDGGYVVYKGTGTSSGTITNLTNGTIYYFKIFARKGTTWVAGSVVNCTPQNNCGSESFDNICTSSCSPATSSYGNRTWTGTNGTTWTATEARTDQTITGKAITIRNGTLTFGLTSAQQASGIESLTISAKAPFGSPDVGTLQLVVNGNTISSKNTTGLTTSSVVTYTWSGINVASISSIVINQTATGSRITIDDISWTCYTAPCTIATNVTNAATSNCQNSSATVSWQNTSCFDEIMVVAKAGTFSATLPTGNGSAYTASSTYGSGGTAFDGGYVVYKGTGTSSGTITSLTNGTAYNFKIFARKGTNWSSGVVTGCTPVLGYCAATSNGCDEYIYNFAFNTIDNTSTPYSCGTNGYSDYASIATTVYKGQTYTASLGIGTDPSSGTPYGNDTYFLADDIYIWVDWNGDGDFDDAGELVVNRNNIDNDGGPGSYDITVPAWATTGATRMRVRLFRNNENSPCGATTWGETEDYTIIIANPCSPLISITDFNPQSGPALTKVNITGSGFNNLNGTDPISINGVNVSTYTVIDNNNLQIEIPLNTATAEIIIKDNQQCETQTSAFTVLNQSGNCGTSGGTGTSLMISEVYDSDYGSCHYIEIFNPTASAVNLAPGGGNDWTLKIYTPSEFTIDLSGTIASGGVHVVRFYNESCSSCAGTVTANQSQNGGGFNANDYIRLYQGATKIDEVKTPNQTGYTLKREPHITSPNTTYKEAEWDISLTEICAHLGTAPFNAGSVNVNIVHPTGSAGCSPTFTVNGTTASTGSPTYQWKYNNGTASGWTNLPNGSWNGLTVSGATSHTLTFSGNGTAIDGYQFYCEITGGSCIKSSNAVQFKYENYQVYRTKASGNWTLLSVWETAPAASATTWYAACEYPTAANSSAVIIKNGNKVTLNTDVSIDSTVIEHGGELEIGTTVTYTVLNGNSGAADLYVYGTLTDRGNQSRGLDFEDNSGTANDASWLLGANGTIVKTNQSSVNNYRDFYQGGISNIPATANWYFRYNGNIVSTTAVGMFYPNLHFENTANTGNYSFNNLAEVFTGGQGGFATVKGDLNIGVTGTGTVTVINNNFNAQPMLIKGDLLIESGSTLTNQAYKSTTDGNYNSSWREGTGFQIEGSMLIEGILDVNSVELAPAQNNIGLLRFSAGNNQDVLGSGTMDLWNVEVNKSAGMVALDKDITVNNDITLANGTLNATGKNISVGRNWTNSNATFTHGNGKVIFFGNENSTVNSGGLGIGKRFYVLEVDKSSNAVTVTTAGNVKADNLTEIKTGTLNVNSNHTYESKQVKLQDSNSKLDIKPNAAMYVNP